MNDVGKNILTSEIMERLKAQHVWFDRERIFMELSDHRVIGCPINWFPRLARATDEQKKGWELIAGGTGVHWEEIDEDLSVEGMLRY